MTNAQVVYTVQFRLGRGIHVQGRMEQDNVRFHHAAKNGTQFKTYDLWNFPFNIFGLQLTVGT